MQIGIIYLIQPYSFPNSGDERLLFQKAVRQQIKCCDKRSFCSAGASRAGGRQRCSCLSANMVAPEQCGLPPQGLCQRRYHHRYRVAGSTRHYVQRSPKGHWTSTLWLKAKTRLSPRMPPNKHTHQSVRDANLSGAITAHSACAGWQEGSVKLDTSA